MLKLLAGALPQARRAALAHVAPDGLCIATASNVFHARQYASQPAPSPAESVSLHFSARFACWHNVTHYYPCARLGMQSSTKMLINGEFRDSETSEWVDVTNPVGIEAGSVEL